MAGVLQILKPPVIRITHKCCYYRAASTRPYADRCDQRSTSANNIAKLCKTTFFPLTQDIEQNARVYGFRAALTRVQGIVSIEPRLYFAQLNQSQDYSFLDTPLRANSTNATSDHTSNAANGAAGTADAARGNMNGESGGVRAGLPSRVVLREPLPNRRMPAYLQGQLVWGSPPVAGPEVTPAAYLLPDVPCDVLAAVLLDDIYSLLFSGEGGGLMGSKARLKLHVLNKNVTAKLFLHV